MVCGIDVAMLSQQLYTMYPHIYYPNLFGHVFIQFNLKYEPKFKFEPKLKFAPWY